MIGVTPSQLPATPGYIGALVVTQTAAVAIALGWRKVVVPVSAGLGLTAGMSIILLPTAALTDGYTIATNAWVASPTSVEVMVQAPLLTIGASYSFTMRIVRIL